MMRADVVSWVRGGGSGAADFYICRWLLVWVISGLVADARFFNKRDITLVV